MINIDALNDDEKLAALESIHKSIAESKEIQKKKITTNVEMILKALKKIEGDLKQRYDETGKLIANLKNGTDGRDGKEGRDGKDGRAGKDGAMGPRGYDGLPGRNGLDGEDGVSITDAHIDFDGSLIISLSSGRVINVGEVVTADIAERIKVITNGGGTSQYVLDTLASLQSQISAISSGLEYQGTWNASTNVPTLASSVGTAGYYYIVATAGSTNLNGITDWQVGDWAVFNGSVWQKIDQTNLVTSVAGRTGAIVLTTADIGGLGTIATQAASAVAITGGSINSTTVGATTASTGAFTTLSASSTATLSGLTASTALALDASKNIVSVTNTGTGSNVLATSPTLITPALGTPSALVGTNITGTASGLTAGTVTTNANLTGAVTSVGNTSSLGSFTSAQLATALTDETGSGANVFATSPTLVTPALGTPSSGVVTNLTGTASININGTVGATTATTGAFTSLTASTTLGVTGVSTFSAGTAALPALTTTGDTNTGIFFPAADTVAFTEGGVEAMRIDSGGRVNIRTTSANAYGFNLAVLTNIGLIPTTQDTVGSIVSLQSQLGSSGGESFIQNQILTFTNGANYTTGLTFNLRTGASEAEQMRLTSTGLGIGTSSPTRKLHVRGTGALFNNATGAFEMLIGDENYRYFGIYTPSSPDYIAIRNGTTDIVRFDALASNVIVPNGSLGIGTSSPSVKLEVAGAAKLTGTNLAIVPSTATNPAYVVNTNTGGNFFVGIDNSTGASFGAGAYGRVLYSSAAYPMVFFTNDLERMRISSAGNVGIGTSSPTAKFQVDGANVTFDTNVIGQALIRSTTAYNSTPRAGIGFSVKYNSGGAQTAGGSSIQCFKENATDGDFGTGFLFTTQANGAAPAERMRLDSSGNLLVGTTSGSDRLTVNGTSASISSPSGSCTFTISGQNAASANAIITLQAPGSNSGTLTYIRSTSLLQAQNGGSGGVTLASGGTAWVAVSDERKKENLVPIANAITKVSSLRSVTGNYIADPDKKSKAFLIAQDVEAVFPEAVDKSDPDVLGLAYTDVIPLLVAAIKEQQALINSLKARLDAANL